MSARHIRSPLGARSLPALVAALVSMSSPDAWADDDPQLEQDSEPESPIVRRMGLRIGAQIGATQRSIPDPPTTGLFYDVPWSAMLGIDAEFAPPSRKRAQFRLRVRYQTSLALAAETRAPDGHVDEMPLRSQRFDGMLGFRVERRGNKAGLRIGPELGYQLRPVFSHVEQPLPNYMVHGPVVTVPIQLSLANDRVMVEARPDIAALALSRELHAHYGRRLRVAVGGRLAAKVWLFGKLALGVAWEQSYAIGADDGVDTHWRTFSVSLGFDDLR